MRLTIQRNQIHHLKEPILDAEGNPTGEEKDVLQFDISSPDYPNLPTYGIRVDFPITKEKVKAEILALVDRVKTQMQRDGVIRQNIEDMGYLDFDSDQL